MPSDRAALPLALRGSYPEQAVVILADPATTYELDMQRMLHQSFNL